MMHGTPEGARNGKFLPFEITASSMEMEQRLTNPFPDGRKDI